MTDSAPPTRAVTTPAKINFRPKLLDLFGGAGGSGVGYDRAGFDVTILDIEPHPDAPLPVVVADAMEVLADTAYLSQFAVVHAGPPCQGYCTMNRWRGKTPGGDLTPRLIAEVRDRLIAWGGTYVIENVDGARKHMLDPIRLRGGHFGLGVDRPRLFESNVALTVPPHTPVVGAIGVYGPLDGRRLYTRKNGSIYRAAKTLDQARTAMGIDWMQWDDLREAVPPAYTEWVGRQIADEIRAAVAA
ncbi:MAG: hypothetical protein JWO15_3889 [Sphingomonadales bacterium]|nr:hypothetical protein [Sphingomonadales bacterium]